MYFVLIFIITHDISNKQTHLSSLNCKDNNAIKTTTHFKSRISTHSGALPGPYVPGRMCQAGLHVVLWSHIGFIMHRLAAEPHTTAGLLFPSQYLSGTILMTLYSMVWDWWVSRVRPIPFCWPSCLLPFCLLLFIPFSSFLLWVGTVGLESSDQ